MKNVEKAKATKTKFSPLTILLFTVLALYAAVMLVMFFWVFITASKTYVGDYSSFEPDLYPDNIVGWPKEFVLFANIAEPTIKNRFLPLSPSNFFGNCGYENCC